MAERSAHYPDCLETVSVWASMLSPDCRGEPDGHWSLGWQAPLRLRSRKCLIVAVYNNVGHWQGVGFASSVVVIGRRWESPDVMH